MRTCLFSPRVHSCRCCSHETSSACTCRVLSFLSARNYFPVSSAHLIIGSQRTGLLSYTSETAHYGGVRSNEEGVDAERTRKEYDERCEVDLTTLSDVDFSAEKHAFEERLSGNVAAGGHHTHENEEMRRGRTWRAHNTIPRLGAFHFLVYRLSRAHNGCNDSRAREGIGGRMRRVLLSFATPSPGGDSPLAAAAGTQAVLPLRMWPARRRVCTTWAVFI